MSFTHLQQRPSGTIYHYTETLAKRKDMIPCNLDGKGKPTSGLSPDVPVSMQQDMGIALARIDALEAQLSEVVSVVASMPGGSDVLKSRESNVAVAIPTPPEPQKPALPSSAPDQSDMASDEDVEIQVARQDVVDAEQKVAAQEKYLTERTEVHTNAVASKDELKAARETAETDDDRARLDTDFMQAQQTVKGANIKVKSATTKLKNAQTQLADAKEKLAGLLEPAG